MTDDRKENYLQEMRALSSLSVGAECPHIVRYFNSWIEDERVHIVMELCQQSLHDVKREAKKRLREVGSGIAEPEIRKIIRDTLLGLAELHA